MAIKKGSQVRQKLPAPIQGEVTDVRIDGEAMKVQVIVSWEAGDAIESRTFNLDEIEELPQDPAP